MEIGTEDRYTSARAHCPHPDRWHSTDAQSTELEVSELAAGFIRALQPDYVLETGCFTGQTTEILGLALKANGQGRLDSIEVDPEAAQITEDRCEGLPVTVRRCSSLDFVPRRRIDFAWLDSLHRLRVLEFERYRPWFNARTIVAFHDTAPHQGGLREQVEAIPGTRFIHLPTPRGVTFVQLEG